MGAERVQMLGVHVYVYAHNCSFKIGLLWYARQHLNLEQGSDPVTQRRSHRKAYCHSLKDGWEGPDLWKLLSVSSCRINGSRARPED